MKIALKESLEGVAPSQLSGFFEGWATPPTDSQLHDMLRGSYRIVLAMDGDAVVGIINAISDGVLYSYIPLLEVKAPYRNKGIGTLLIKQLLMSLNKMYAIDLCCDDAVVALYKQCGFTKINGMIIRNYANQPLSGDLDLGAQ